MAPAKSVSKTHSLLEIPVVPVTSVTIPTADFLGSQIKTCQAFQ